VGRRHPVPRPLAALQDDVQLWGGQVDGRGQGVVGAHGHAHALRITVFAHAAIMVRKCIVFFRTSMATARARFD
jgi:hypothetical protein